MSLLMMSKCWPLQMPPTAKSVLISLADVANDYGVCCLSVSFIVERTCFSDRAIRNAIQWLENNGVLVASRSNGRKTSYQICPEKFTGKRFEMVETYLLEVRP